MTKEEFDLAVLLTQLIKGETSISKFSEPERQQLEELLLSYRPYLVSRQRY